MNQPLEDVPRIDIPLHTLMELVPKADGTMAETRYHIDVDRALQMTGYVDFGGLKVERFYGGSTTEEEEDAEEAEAVAGVPHTSPGLEGGLQRSALPIDHQTIGKSLSMADLAAAELVTAREVLSVLPDDGV